MSYFKKIFFPTLFLSLIGCGHSQEEKLATYKNEVSNYDCNSLNVENRYNEKIIKKLSKPQENYNPAEDIAVTVLTLGTDLIPDSASVSTKRNISNRAKLFEEKNQIIQETYTKRCHS